MKVGGKVVLEAEGEDFAGKASGAVRMNKGRNPIEVVYASPAKGDAWVRVLWESRDFPAEPVQPGVLSHDVSEKGSRRGAGAGGAGVAGDVAVRGMSSSARVQLPMGAGDAGVGGGCAGFVGRGGAVEAGWMAAWISDPRKLRADASMPRVFHRRGASRGRRGTWRRIWRRWGSRRNAEAAEAAERRR